MKKNMLKKLLVPEIELSDINFEILTKVLIDCN